MKRTLLSLLFLLCACVPALRVYEAGQLSSTRRTFQKFSNQKPKYEGVEHVFWLTGSYGLLQKPRRLGIDPKKTAPIALTLFCPSGNGTVRTVAIIGLIVWVPVLTRVYCAPDAPKATPSTTPNNPTPDTRPAGPTREEEAARFFEQAEIDYKLLKYSSALENYQRAYEKVQSPELLFNIAQCYRLLERYQEAVTTYETFLREDPNTNVKPEVEKLLAETKKKLKQQKKKSK